jgi:hypothetical protein
MVTVAVMGSGHSRDDSPSPPLPPALIQAIGVRRPGYGNAATRKDVGHAVHESKLNEGEVMLGGQLAPYKVEHLHGPLREEGRRRDGVSAERTEVGIVKLDWKSVDLTSLKCLGVNRLVGLRALQADGFGYYH